MKSSTADTARKPARRAGGGNGAAVAVRAAALPEGDDRGDRRALLAALQAVAEGDFSVRLPGDWTGLDGKIADRFNDIVAANQQDGRRACARRTGRRTRRARRGSACSFAALGRRVGRDAGVAQHADRRPGASDHRGDARGDGGRAGQPAADRAPRRRRPAARRRVPALGDDRQHDDQAALRVHVGGDARRARGRHRRQARRTGAGARVSAACGRT